MTTNKKYVRKSFFAHQYEKEEEFLSKMAREGWHFVSLHKGIPTKYEFEKGEPIDYIYQLDYVTTEEDTENYHQLFTDAGWDEVLSWDGIYDGKWHCFRRIRTEGKELRIFTDEESKYRLYEKLLKKYGLFYLIIICLEASAFRIVTERLAVAEFPSLNGFGLAFFFCVFSSVVIFYSYMLFGLQIKKSRIKKNLDKHL